MTPTHGPYNKYIYIYLNKRVDSENMFGFELIFRQEKPVGIRSHIKKDFKNLLRFHTNFSKARETTCLAKMLRGLVRRIEIELNT